MKQWYSKIGHNSGQNIETEHLGQRVINRPYGTFPDGYVSMPIETPSLLESMPGIGAERFCAAMHGYLSNTIDVNELFARIGARS